MRDLVASGNVNPIESSVLKKRAKSNLKVFSPTKEMNPKLAALSSSVLEAEKQAPPARINDLINAANHG